MSTMLDVNSSTPRSVSLLLYHSCSQSSLPSSLEEVQNTDRKSFIITDDPLIAYKRASFIRVFSFSSDTKALN